MYLRVPLYKYEICSTYGYLHISISSVVLTGYFCTRISYGTPTRDLYKNKPIISFSIIPVTPTGDVRILLKVIRYK